MSLAKIKPRISVKPLELLDCVFVLIVASYLQLSSCYNLTDKSRSSGALQLLSVVVLSPQQAFLSRPSCCFNVLSALLGFLNAILRYMPTNTVFGFV